MTDGSIIHDAPTPGAARPRSAPDDVWDRVREDYLAGVSAPECCRAHGVGLTALRDRARTGNWRRMDQPFSPPQGRLDPWDEGLALDDRVGGDLDKVELCELSFVATRRFMRAVLRGDAAEALRWRRVRVAIDEEAAEMERFLAQEEALQVRRDDEADCAAEYGHADRLAARFPACPPDPDDPDYPDDPDGVFRPSRPGGAGRPTSHPDDPHDPDSVFAPPPANPARPPAPQDAPPDLERKGLASADDLHRLLRLRSRLPLRPGREQRPRLVHRAPGGL